MIKGNILNADRRVATWLFFTAFLVFLMVVVGGITRLTDSGLSIVEWKPIAGILPPLNLEDWENLFSQYRLSPEFVHLHPDMTLNEFKNIFWWEYFHRVLGRIIGLVFLIPFVIFTFQKKIPSTFYKHILILFILGGIQGYMGWYMVKSGLVDDPFVSPLRLMIHLGLALLLYAYLIILGLRILRIKSEIDYLKTHSYRKVAHFALAITTITILSGALVAGLDAGLIYNTFPLMGNGFVPSDYFSLSPWYLNFFFNPANAQFNHRVLALFTFGFITYFWVSGFSYPLPKVLKQLLHILMLVASFQLFLGIATLLLVVPVPLASLHQMNALLLFTLILIIFVQLRERRK